MRLKEFDPRGRFVRRHARKLFNQPGRFTVVEAYQELIDRLRKRPKLAIERQMNLPFGATAAVLGANKFEEGGEAPEGNNP